ncbi:hypothetical protein [Viridibacterium curvum]|uniref:hypothetical protein n=1 Tax=Viridibacterium curvum TaxID=1101404 RepID=UPI0031EB931D
MHQTIEGKKAALWLSLLVLLLGAGLAATTLFFALGGHSSQRIEFAHVEGVVRWLNVEGSGNSRYDRAHPLVTRFGIASHAGTFDVPSAFADEYKRFVKVGETNARLTVAKDALNQSSDGTRIQVFGLQLDGKEIFAPDASNTTRSDNTTGAKILLGAIGLLALGLCILFVWHSIREYRRALRSTHPST